MIIDGIENIEFSDNSRLNFDYDLSRLNWFNIGGKTKIYFAPNSLKDLSLFLRKYNNRGKIFILGAGSNTLFDDSTYEGVVIKLGKNFHKITKLNENLIISGSSCFARVLCAARGRGYSHRRKQKTPGPRQQRMDPARPGGQA